jgi:hypothetical protein
MATSLTSLLDFLLSVFQIEAFPLLASRDVGLKTTKTKQKRQGLLYICGSTLTQQQDFNISDFRYLRIQLGFQYLPLNLPQ